MSGKKFKKTRRGKAVNIVKKLSGSFTIDELKQKLNTHMKGYERIITSKELGMLMKSVQKESGHEKITRTLFSDQRKHPKVLYTFNPIGETI